METYKVTLYKAIKGNEKRHFKGVSKNAVSIFWLPKLCESVEGRLLVGRFADLCFTRKSTGASYLVAKEVGVLGTFTSKDLEEEIENRGTTPQIKSLIERGEFIVGTDYHLFLFKGELTHPKIRKAFIERYFATCDMNLDVTPWGTRRTYFIDIEKVDE